MSKVHDLINAERKRRGLPHVYWSREMAQLAHSQANYCARVGHLVHSSRFAFQGGENLAEGGRRFGARAIVGSWLRSKAGHREYLLSHRVTKAGVGIARRHGNTFVAWAFSDSPPSYPDCPGLKTKQHFKFAWTAKFPGKGRRTMKPLSILVSLALGLLAVLGILLGAHGLYTYFNRVAILFGGDNHRLFYAISVPSVLQGALQWATAEGFQSWVVPAAVLVGGLLLLNYSGALRLIARWKLWFLCFPV